MRPQFIIPLLAAREADAKQSVPREAPEPEHPSRKGAHREDFRKRREERANKGLKASLQPQKP
jgi:hypothetical protein